MTQVQDLHFAMLNLKPLALAHQSSLSDPSAELFYPSADDAPVQHSVSCKLTQDAPSSRSPIKVLKGPLVLKRSPFVFLSTGETGM